MSITIDIRPCPAPRQTKRDRWLKPARPCVQRYRDFKDQLRMFSDRERYILQVPLSLTFRIEMPESWAKKKRLEMNGKPHLQTPDLDNLIKAFQDALLKDDSAVWKYGTMQKIWAEKGSITIH
ncbi:MAG: RusA family crossover junction endodeoxyribonuclease [Pseudoalteromonas sp.]